MVLVQVFRRSCRRAGKADCRGILGRHAASRRRYICFQARRFDKLGLLEAFAIGAVEEDAIAVGFPDRRKLHGPGPETGIDPQAFPRDA